MEEFRHHKEWENKCRQNIWWKKNCTSCLFEALCIFEKNQERTEKDNQKKKILSRK